MMFNDLYSEFTGKKFKATDEYSDKDIEKAILFHQGDSIPGFPSFDSFLYLIQPQLEKLKEPALDCVQNVFIFMENLASKLIERIFVLFSIYFNKHSSPHIFLMNEIPSQKLWKY